MMVRPASFAHNPHTAHTNRFQHQVEHSADLEHQARTEFDAAVRRLTDTGIRVCVVDDTAAPDKPDALFPNNWISFHRDGTIVLYPMLATNRRCERRPEIPQMVEQQLGFRRRGMIDLSGYEQEGRFLEGTGSLVLDHVQRVAYASRSARTDESLVRLWSRKMQYEPLLFDAVSDGMPIYHTNVVLSIGTSWAVVCGACIADADRERVLTRLRQDRDLIEIPAAVMGQFGANILELQAGGPGPSGQRVLALSERAASAFEQMSGNGWQRLRDCVDRVLPIAVPVIEEVGGGGIRCMLAEVPDVAQ